MGEGSSCQQIVDSQRQGDPADFWTGFQLTLLPAAGNRGQVTRVSEFNSLSGCLTLDPPLSGAIRTNAPYELSCSLEAPIVGIRYLLGLSLAKPIAALRLRLGTTRGTNALLTRSGAKTALVTTAGFGDLLEIGNQDRPRLFELNIHKPPPLAITAIEIDQRVTATGQVLRSPNRTTLQNQLQRLRRSGIESLAICLLHADRLSGP